MASSEDAVIMGTNSYSIVSKRSVEQIHSPDTPQFLKEFVSKPKRRAPLINRGYWLRVKAIENNVSRFLSQGAFQSQAETFKRADVGNERQTSRIIVNLGCGQDTLPFHVLTQLRQDQSGECIDDVLFIDIDYVALMEQKVQKVLDCPLLSDAAGPLRSDLGEANAPLLLHTSNYIALGADLNDLPAVSLLVTEAVREHYSHIPGSFDGSILFIAEVSITYMAPAQADRLIAWTSSAFAEAQVSFVLLEQFLPAGIEHPFAETMLSHFNKSAPLKSITAYPELEDQSNRFKTAGWKTVQVSTLWEIWHDHISDDERHRLELAEPFDEWEEFALFCAHYFVLVAFNSEALHLSSRHSVPREPRTLYKDGDTATSVTSLKADAISFPVEGRRFAAGLAQHSTLLNSIIHLGGYASNNRLSTQLEEYKASSGGESSCGGLLSSLPSTIPDLPSPLACFTATALQDGGMYIIAGGRSSPSKASSECWTLRNDTGPSNPTPSWMPSARLEPGRFRHAATKVTVGTCDGLLVFGGKTSDGTVLNSWSLYIPTNGNEWTAPAIDSTKIPSARFGASICTLKSTEAASSGLLIGGLDSSHRLLADIWEWSISRRKDGSPEIRITFVERSRDTSGLGIGALSRFGAAMILPPSEMGGCLLIGGIGPLGIWRPDTEIVYICDDLRIQPVLAKGWDKKRPLLIGHTAMTIDDKVAIVGGGAVCFSFGSFWNRSLSLLSISPGPGQMKLAADNVLSNAKSCCPSESVTRGSNRLGRADQVIQATSDIVGLLVSSETPAPFVLCEQDIGHCTALWSPSYLVDKVGSERLVTIHESSTQSLKFASKNFKYATVPFQALITRACAGEHVYMRALAEGREASRKPACLARNFNTIASDFTLPADLVHSVREDDVHSTVLRIAGDIEMWLHYDVMANLLCQVRGRKRVVLFPPRDVLKLGFKPGATTSEIDIFGEYGLHVRGIDAVVHPQSVVLEPGDCLFIPACWPHATAPSPSPSTEKVTDGSMSVAVNTFFASLRKGYSAGRDVYGNRDLDCYQNGRRDLSRIRDMLNGQTESEKRESISKLLGCLRSKNTIESSPTIAGMKEAIRIRSSVQFLPDQLRSFYLTRLAAELEDMQF